MAEQYCFLGWLHHILWPFILPTFKQRGAAEVHCSCLLLKPWSASPEAVPLPRGKQNQSLSPRAGMCSMQHCINAISIILEWREKQNVQLKLCWLFFFFLREFTARERCQIEGSGKCSPRFKHCTGEEWGAALPATRCCRCLQPCAAAALCWLGRARAPTPLPCPVSAQRLHSRLVSVVGPSGSSKAGWKRPAFAREAPELGWGAMICTCCPKTVSFHGERTSVVPPAPSCLPQPSPVKASSPGGGSSLCPGLCCSKGWRNGASSLLAVTGPGCGRRAALTAAASTFKGETTKKKKKALP